MIGFSYLAIIMGNYVHYTNTYKIKTHDSESRGQEEAAYATTELVIYM